VFKIKIYKTADGKQPIKDYIAEISGKAQTGNKDAVIRLEKIDYCLQALRNYGTHVGYPIVKHIDDGIWELRPLRDRFFFFFWQDDCFVLLHHFIKKTQKTPKRAFEQAKRNMKDFAERSKQNEQK
jgi:phage-related protein